MNINKKCSKCETLKLKTEFHKDRRKSDGRNTICKKCRNKPLGPDGGLDDSTPTGKCECSRGGAIFKKDCIPGCNDACKTCKNPQTKNVKASSDTYTAEEEMIMKHSGGRGGSMDAALNDAIW